VRRFASSATAAAVALPVFERHSLSRTHLIFGANTDVGKTLTCAGLVRASLAQTTEVSDTTNTLVHYMKPLQCGGSDEKFIERHCPSSQLHRLSRRTLFDWKTPASPHVASRKEKSPVSDHEVLSEIQSTLSDIAVKSSNSGQASTTWIETAGGVLSPSSASPNNCSPSHASDSKDGWGWVTQGDLYHPLSTTASVVLIGDGRLGGKTHRALLEIHGLLASFRLSKDVFLISTPFVISFAGISATLSSLESLMIRGYNVAGIVLLETGYDNVTAIREYAGR